MSDQLPGAEFFFDRIKAAEQLPEEQRTADQQLMLQLHQEIMAVAAALRPPAQGSAAAASGSPAATAALLRYMAADWCAAPTNIHHPAITPQSLAQHLPPLVDLSQSEGRVTAFTGTRQLDDYLNGGPLPAVSTGGRLVDS